MSDAIAKIARSWQQLSTNRRVLAKSSAMLAALSVFDFTSGDAQNDPEQTGSTRAVDWYEDTDPESVIAADRDGFVTIATDFPFTAVGASWSGDVGIWPLVEIQLSSDGETFGDLIVLEADPDTGRPTRDDRIFTRLLFANGEWFIRYRTTDRNGVPVPVQGFGLTYIDASAGPTLDDLQSVEPADITTPPSIISRAGWGADESLRFSSGTEVFPREYRTVSHAVVHHSETPNDSDPLLQMRSIYYFHAISRGWGDIGYNYLVDKYGNVYEGRVGGQGVVGAHALAHNYGTAGVCLIGDHLVASPTAQAVSALVGILSWICRGLDPLGSSDFLDLRNLPTICGHRDVNIGYTCPGGYASAMLPSVRSSVASTIGSSPQSPPGGFVVGDLTSIATGDGVPVNLRDAAGTGSPVAAQLTDGLLAMVAGTPVQSDGINWYPIATHLGSGWVAASYLERQEPPFVASARFAYGDLVATNRSTTVLLVDARSSAAVAATISQAMTMRVQAGPRFLGGTIWYRLGESDDSIAGWGNQNDFVLSAHPGATGSPAPGNTVSVTALTNFRVEPSTSAPLLGQLPLGTEASVIGGPRTGSGYTWFQLRTAYGSGWVTSNFLRPSGSGGMIPTPTPAPGKFRAGDTVTNPGALNLRSQPALSGSVIALMSANTSGTVLGGPTSANGYSWYQIQTRYGTGWAAGELLDASAVVPTPAPPPGGGFPIGSAVAATSPVNMRSAASLSGAVLAVLPPGTTGSVLAGPTNASGYAWYRLQTNWGSGWVAASFLKLTSAPGGIQIGSTVRTTTGLRLRSAASTSGSIITTLPSNTRGTVLSGPIDANGYTWWQLKTSLGTGWAAGAYLVIA